MRSAVLPNKIAISEINAYETKFLYDEIFVRKTYMRHGVEINDGDVIIDAGANIGMFALYTLIAFNPGRIYCFEPAPHCLEALRFNLTQWKDRVVISDSALGEAIGTADFTFYPGYSIMSGLFADKDRDLAVLKAGASTQFSKFGFEQRMIDALVGDKLERSTSLTCAVTTISDVIDKNDIASVDLLKIDVERAENAILLGVRDEHWRRIKQVVVEVHDQGAREHEAMRDMLADKGFATALDVEEGLENSAIYALTARRT